MNGNSNGDNDKKIQTTDSLYGDSEADLTLNIDYDLDDPMDQSQSVSIDTLDTSAMSEDFVSPYKVDFKDIEFNEAEFSDAYDQTLSSTLLAMKGFEKARIDNPTSQDLEDADTAVKWLRKNRLAQQDKPLQVESTKPVKSSRLFRVFATLMSLLLVVYFLLTRTTYLSFLDDLISQWLSLRG